MQRSQMPTEDDNWKKRSKSKKKTLRLEYRIRPERWLSDSMWRSLGINNDWALCSKKYRTEDQREMAMTRMNKKDTLFEYRIPIHETECSD